MYAAFRHGMKMLQREQADDKHKTNNGAAGDAGKVAALVIGLRQVTQIYMKGTTISRELDRLKGAELIFALRSAQLPRMTANVQYNT